MKFFKRAFAITIIASLLMLIGALAFFSVGNRVRITSENQVYLLDNARQTARSIDQTLSEGYANIEMLADLVSRSLTDETFSIESIRDIVGNTVFDFMEFADKDGNDHNIIGGISDARDRKYYLDAKQGNSGMELIYVSRATHETLLMFYAPVYYENTFVGSLIGVFQASNRITKLLTKQYFGENATTYLATETGRVIASNQQLNPENEIYVTDLANGDEALIVKFESAVQNVEEIRFDVPGNMTGGCMIPLEKNGWYLVEIFPYSANDSMIKDANSLGYILVLVLLVLFIAIIMLVVIFYRGQQKVIEESRLSAEKANEAKTSFLFNMSHDIRTPMNAIIGFTNLAKKHTDQPERVRDCLTKIEISGNHLLELINEVLDMSRVEAGKLRSDVKSADIVAMAQRLTDICRENAAQQGVTLTLNVKDIRNRNVMMDELHVSRILMNILGNAVKYTPKGGSVTFMAEEVTSDTAEYGKYRFTVEDTGIGMSKEFVSRIFESFSREERKENEGVQGTGLGMAIVKRLVEYMDGSIDIESETGKGTRVTVVLQMIKADSAAEAAVAEQTDVQLQGKRILLAEDNEMNREIAVELLEEQGFVVEEAVNGLEAVEKVRENGVKAYDCVLMDIQMPLMNGYDATRQIRKLPGADKLVVIALSANAFEEDRLLSVEAGMNDHLAKPINMTQLLNTLAKYL